MAVLAGLVVLLLLNLESVVGAVQDRLTAYRYQKQLDELEKPYREDKYGGKTPEETFDLFIVALKKEDIDLASKYFTIPKQESWRATLDKYRTQKLLANFTAELEKTSKEWERVEIRDPDVVEFNSYITVDQATKLKFKDKEFDVPIGNYLNTTRFEKYPSGIWKISLL